MMHWQPGVSLDEMERNTIIEALQFYGGSRKKASEALKVGYRTLLTKIALYKEQGISVPVYIGRVPEPELEAEETPKVVIKKAK